MTNEHTPRPYVRWNLSFPDGEGNPDLQLPFPAFPAEELSTYPLVQYAETLAQMQAVLGELLAREGDSCYICDIARDLPQTRGKPARSLYQLLCSTFSEGRPYGQWLADNRVDLQGVTQGDLHQGRILGMRAWIKALKKIMMQHARPAQESDNA